jgi:3D (Asp-Asp-Asp) domain-containing protein
MVTVTELNRAANITANAIDAGSVSATAELANPTYATLSDVPTNLPEGTQVYVKDENQLYVEDGT